MPTYRGTDHPPYCTCYRCNEGRQGRRFLKRQSSSRPSRSHQRITPTAHQRRSSSGWLKFLAWLILTMGVSFLALWIVYDETHRNQIAGWFDSLSEMSEDGVSARQKDTKPVYTISEIVETYDTNHFAGDQKFKNKVFEVTGEVASLGYSVFLEVNYLGLSASRPFRTRSIMCTIKDRDLDQFANLQDGQIVTVRGEGRGMVPMTGFVIRHCTLVQ